MKKNSQYTFNAVPKINIPRNKFKMSFSHKTSFNQGEIVPFYLQEVIPGDTFNVKSSMVIRTSSPLLKPIMDNIFLDTYYFYVPARLLYDKWPQIFGENANGAWAESEFAEVPMNNDMESNDEWNFIGTVGDHLGLPVVNIKDLLVDEDLPAGVFSVLPFRAFAKIYDDWFRDENIIAPMNIARGETTGAEELNDSEWSINNYFGKLPKIAKLHDYFTSALPSPQKGSPVTFNVAGGFAPVGTFAGANGISTLNNIGNLTNLTWGAVNTTNGTVSSFGQSGGIGTSAGSRTYLGPTDSSQQQSTIIPTNLSVNLDSLNAISVNDLRFAFQLQKMLERDARGGTRYTEYIHSHFNVLNPDSRLQRAEYLGGTRNPLNITQVTQTTGYDADELGTVGAYSLSSGKSGFIKSFTEHGYIIGVCAVRQFHTYQQGLGKLWSRRKRTDFYDPVFANIGEQPIYGKEIYLNASNLDTSSDLNVFGFQEAWADMRYNVPQITGEMRSGIDDSLELWHLADYYTTSPILSKSFIEENRGLSKVLGTPSQNDFIVDIYNDISAIRPLPLYSIPGLIDHN